MIVLAPPVLFTLGLGMSDIVDSDERFLDLRVGYQVVEHVAVGVRLRRSHTELDYGDVYSSGGVDINHLDTYDLDTTDIGAIADLEIGRWVVIAPWLGLHMASGDASYSESRTDTLTGESVGGYHAEEQLAPGPVFAAGLIAGFNVYSCGRVRVTGFAETQSARSAFLTNRSPYASYVYRALSLGVAVRF